MNTIRPNLQKSSAFDALIGNKFTFTYSGSQVVKNELIIRDNITNNIIYQETAASFQLFHTLPDNILANGITYNAQIRAYDINNIASEWSNTIIFTCLKTPSFYFSNLTPNQVIQNSNYEFTLSYQQDNNEPLNTTKIVLYKNGAEKYSTGSKFGTSMLSANVNGLEDNTKYEIRATGETLNGIIVDTGLISFSIDYIEPSLWAMVDLENLCHTGEVRIQSNIISIIGTSNPSPPTYIDDTKVDLTENGSWVMFDEGFSIKDNFCLQLECNALNSNTPILIMTNEKYKITLHYMEAVIEEIEVAYLILKASNALTNYYQTSNYIYIPHKTDNLYIMIRKINQTYQVFFENPDYPDYLVMLSQHVHAITEQGDYIILESETS